MQFLSLLLLCFCIELSLIATLPQEIESTFPSQSLIAQKHLATLTPAQMDINWNLNDFFGSVVIINLPRCTDRLASIKEKLNEIGCKDFTVFSAVDGRAVVPEQIWQKFCLNWAKLDLSTEDGKTRFDNQRKGEAGCYYSHYHVIKGVKENFDKALDSYQKAIAANDENLKKTAYQDLLKYRSVMILEDDTAFGIRNEDRMSASLKNSGKTFYEAMAEMPTEWEMFYFMTYSRHQFPNQLYKPHLIKVKGGYSAIAYAVNYQIYERLLQRLSEIDNPAIQHVMPVDSVYSRIHVESSCCFAVLPSIAYQKIGMSTINSLITPEIIQFQPYPPY